MGGVLGHPKYGGRKKGATNKRTRDLITILDAAGYCPIAKLIEASEIASQEIERIGAIYDAIEERRSDRGMAPLTDEMPNYLKVIQKSAEAIAPYLYPKRKAVELSAPGGKDIFDSLTQVFKRVADAKAK